ncbi:MAG: PAS domain S-box protein [Burkholderiales bacterium]
MILADWNAGAEAIFGYSSQEVIGQSLDVIIPERLRPPIGRLSTRPWKPAVPSTGDK